MNLCRTMLCLQIESAMGLALLGPRTSEQKVLVASVQKSPSLPSANSPAGYSPPPLEMGEAPKHPSQEQHEQLIAHGKFSKVSDTFPFVVSSEENASSGSPPSAERRGARKRAQLRGVRTSTTPRSMVPAVSDTMLPQLNSINMMSDAVSGADLVDAVFS